MTHGAVACEAFHFVTGHSRIFQFGKVGVKYEQERFQVKQDWDKKVPKQSRFASTKFEVPPAPMPDHLKLRPGIEVAVDDDRKMGNSRFKKK